MPPTAEQTFIPPPPPPFPSPFLNRTPSFPSLCSPPPLTHPAPSPLLISPPFLFFFFFNLSYLLLPVSVMAYPSELQTAFHAGVQLRGQRADVKGSATVACKTRRPVSRCRLPLAPGVVAPDELIALFLGHCSSLIGCTCPPALTDSVGDGERLGLDSVMSVRLVCLPVCWSVCPPGR